MQDHKYLFGYVAGIDGGFTLNVTRNGKRLLSVHLEDAHEIKDRWAFKTYFLDHPEIRKLRQVRAINRFLDGAWFNGLWNSLND